MDFDRFDVILNEMIMECKTTLRGKGTEYAGGKDRFGNFKRMATDAKQIGIDMTPAQAGWFLLSKHLDSIKSILATGIESGETNKSRFADAINYLLLIYGMLIEEQEYLSKLEEKDDRRMENT